MPGLMLAHQSGTFPALAGIVLTGGYPIPEPIVRLSEGVLHDLPIVSTEARHVQDRRAADPGAAARCSSPRRTRLEVARRLFSERVDQDALLERDQRLRRRRSARR